MTVRIGRLIQCLYSKGGGREWRMCKALVVCGEQEWRIFGMKIAAGGRHRQMFHFTVLVL